MAAALGPAYVRISGTWANTTYFADTDTPPKDPPQAMAACCPASNGKGRSTSRAR